MRAARLAGWLLPVASRRYRSALVMGMISVGVFGYVAQWAGFAATSSASAEGGLGSAALRTIQVDSYGRSADPAAITPAAVRAMSELPGVAEAGPWDIAQVAPVGEGFDVVLAVAPRYPAVQRPLLAGAEPRAELEVLLPGSIARKAGVTVGAELPISYNVIGADGNGHGKEATLTVVGLWDDSVPGIDDPQSAYASLATVDIFIAAERGTSPEWIAEHYVYARAFVTVDDLDAVTPTVERLRELGYGASSLTTLLTSASSTQTFLAGVRTVLAVIVVALLGGLAWSTAASILAARRSEIGLLRAIGWTLSEVRSTFVLQLAGMGGLVGLGGAVVGVIVRLAADLVGGGVTVLGTGVAVPWDVTTALWVVVPVVMSALVFVLAGLPPIQRLAQVEPDEVLRDIVR